MDERPDTPGLNRGRLRAKIAVGTWRTPREGAALGFVDVDVTEAEPWWKRFPGVTLTHVVGCAVGRALAASPEARSRVVAGRVLVRESSDVSFIVTTPDGSDLRSVCLRGVDRLHPRDAAARLENRAGEVRVGVDRQLGRSASTLRYVPQPLVRPGLWAAGFLASGLGVAVRPLGLEPHPFGSFVVSSVGMLGIDRALAPLLPVARTSGVLVVGAIEDRPAVVAGSVVARRISTLGATVDHRVLDGIHLAELSRLVRGAVERPWEVWDG